MVVKFFRLSDLNEKELACRRGWRLAHCTLLR
jgi:hypothetical protein